MAFVTVVICLKQLNYDEKCYRRWNYRFQKIDDTKADETLNWRSVHNNVVNICGVRVCERVREHQSVNERKILLICEANFISSF